MTIKGIFRVQTRGEGVLAHGLDGHRKNLLVPVSLKQSFGVRAVVLAPAVDTALRW